MRKTCYGFMVWMILLTLVHSVAAYDYGRGWVSLNDGGNDVLALKAEAKASHRPIVLLMAQPLYGCCTECTQAWLHIFCDGKIDHVEECAAQDDALGNHPIKAWANDNKALLLVSKDNPDLVSAYQNTFGESFPTAYPIVVLAHLKDSADMTSPTLKATEIDLLGAFTMAGKTIHGVAFDGELTIGNFDKVVSSYFPNAYWSSLDGRHELELPDGRVGSLSHLEFNDVQSSHWFTFQGGAGMRALFSAQYSTGATIPERIGFKFYDSAMNVVKYGESAGNRLLDYGQVYYDVPEDGEYHLELYAIAPSGNDGYTLRYHQAASPKSGDVLDPDFEGARLGKWTMDLDAAQSQALVDGHDVIVYFTGAQWCPYCVALEKSLLRTQAFKDWASEHAYLVLIDNRRRLSASMSDGAPAGPSLLLDDFPRGGYLTRHGLTLEGGLARLGLNNQSNVLTLDEWRERAALGENINQNSLVSRFQTPGTPVNSEKAIGYPTLIYVSSDGRIVGRSFSTLDAIRQFQALVESDDLEEEANNYSAGVADDQLNTMGVTLEDGTYVLDGLKIGGVDVCDYYGVTLGGKTFGIEATFRGTSDVPVTVQLFKKGSDVVLASSSGMLSEGVFLLYICDSDVEASYRLKVVPAGEVLEIVDYEASWTFIDSASVGGFADERYDIRQTDTTLSLPVLLKNYSTVDEELTMRATVRIGDGTLKVKPEESTLVWSVEEQLSETTKYVELDLSNSGLSKWKGGRDFSVTLTVESGDCKLEVATATVTVYSLPSLDVDEITLRRLYVGVSSVIDYPLHCGVTGELSWALKRSRIPDWMNVSIELAGGSPVLRIASLPTSAASGTFSIVLKAGRTSGQTIDISYSSYDLSAVNSYGHAPNYRGYAYVEDTHGNRLVQGGVQFRNVESGFSVTGTTVLGDLSCTLPAWTEVDSATGGLKLKFSDDEIDGVVELASDGRATGSLTCGERKLHVEFSPYSDGVAALSDASYSGFYESLETRIGGAFSMEIQSGIPSCKAVLPSGSYSDIGSFVMSESAGVYRILVGLGCGERRFYALMEHDSAATYDRYSLQHVDKVLGAMDGIVEGYFSYGTPMPTQTLSSTLEIAVDGFYLTLETRLDASFSGVIGSTGHCLSETASSDGFISSFSVQSDTCWLGGTVVPASLKHADGIVSGNVNVLVAQENGSVNWETGELVIGLAPKPIYCCEYDETPVGHGFYKLKDGRVFYATLNGSHNNYFIASPGAVELPADASIGTVVSLADGQWMLLVDVEGMLLLKDGDALPAGAWSVYCGPTSWYYKESEVPYSLPLYQVLGTVNGPDNRLNRGWNVIALPWTVSSVSPETKDALLALGTFYGHSSGVMVVSTEIKGGHGYWVYVSEVPEKSIEIQGAPSRKTVFKGKGAWHFGQAPSNWSYGWRWNGEQYERVRSLEELKACEGAWFYQ